MRRRLSPLKLLPLGLLFGVTPALGQSPPIRTPRAAADGKPSLTAAPRSPAAAAPRAPAATPPAPSAAAAAEPEPPGARGALPSNMEAIARAADTPYRPKPAGHMVKFNLQDADLAELVNHISGLTGRRFIYGAKVRQIKATVVSPEPVTLAEAYEAFLSILEANGMTVVPHGRFLKIVDTGGVVTQPTPIYGRGTPVPDADRYITRLYRLQSVTAEEAAQLLAKFKSKDGDISLYAPGQLLILTDTGANIRRMIRLIEEIDVGGAGTRMWIEPVHYGSAADVAKRINELFELGGGPGGAAGAARGGGGGLSKVVPDEQTNSLIIVGTEDSYGKLLGLLRRLDSKPAAEGKIRVLPLQHAGAEELANTLTQLLQGATRAPGQAGAAPGAVSSLFEGEVRVTADKSTNSLIITSSARDYAQLRIVVDELDAPRRQVFIEAVIMDVSVNQTQKLGISYHAGVSPAPLGGENSLLYGGLNPLTSMGLPTDLQGLAIGVRGPDLSASANRLIPGISIPAFGIVLNALATNSDSNVLSTPHIIATDNVAAEISVGENIPLQQNAMGMGSLAGLAGLGGAGTGNLGALAGLGGLGGLGALGGYATPRQDVGTKIKVTPHVNEANQIRLEIDQEISEQGAASGTLGVVSITKRTARTEVVVDDEQTVVIGGLMRDAVVKSRDKIPVLGDLPLLGFLFRSTTTANRKTNLLLILTPYIIRDQADLRKIFERKMQERQEFLDRYFVFSGQDWEPPRDYARANGLVEDIRQAYFQVEEQIRLEEESKPKEPVEHAPSEPLDLPTSVRGTTAGASTAAPAPGATPATTLPATTPTRRRRVTAPNTTNPGAAAPGANPGPQGSLEPPFRINPMARSVNIER